MRDRFLHAALLLCAACSLHAAASSQTQASSLPPVEGVTVAGIRELVRRDSGSVVVVSVWATWCVPCRVELPGLLRLRREYDSLGVKLILVSSDDPDILEREVRPALDTLGVDFVTYIDRDSSEEAFINGMSKDWGGAIPATFLYDRRGVQKAMLVGGKSHDQLRNALLPVMGQAR